MNNKKQAVIDRLFFTVARVYLPSEGAGAGVT